MNISKTSTKRAMKKILMPAILLIILLLLNGRLVFADFAGCNCVCGKFLRPPCGEEDCRVACGGQEPSVSSSPEPYTPPSYDYEAERQRQQEAERQRQAEREERARKEAEEAKQRQIEFEQKREEALRSMKGIAENELGLKGVSADNGLGLKGVGETGSNELGLKTLFENPNGPAPAVDSRVKGSSKLDVGAELKPVGKVDSSVVDLRDVKMEDVNKGLVKNQWEMSIDWRYKHDPVVQKYIHDLWASAFSPDEAKAQEANDKLERILVDQLKADGRDPKEIDAFFAKVRTFLEGTEQTPMTWDKASKLAQDLDGSERALPFVMLFPEKEQQILKKLSKAEGVTADVSYMALGKQTTDDCVLHAIANGAQVPLDQVKTVFEKTVKDLGMDTITARENPQTVITSANKGGRGGLNPLEELLVSEQLGNVVAVSHTDFAKVIENTGRPVITSIDINGGKHEVVVTGVYRTEDKRIYYRVMDSNLTDHNNFTTYIEKDEFYKKMPYEGGFVVVPKNKK